ncbi:MAG TPA: DMT family protein [Anseongella sp.]|nr:DMT family protein [Anseongella sp.]
MMKYILIPLMLCIAGLLMSFAWIGHLKFKSWSFLTALGVSWLLVLPEYILNVFSARWGRDIFSGAQMAAMHLAAGVICVALVSKFYLGEPLNMYQLAGFALMGLSILLIVFKGN